MKTDCTWNCKSIEEEWLLSQELPGCIMNEKTGCTEGKKGVFWREVTAKKKIMAKTILPR